jgi:ribosome-binding protein aMBF1 (putative translation factor)
VSTRTAGTVSRDGRLPALLRDSVGRVGEPADVPGHGAGTTNGGEPARVDQDRVVTRICESCRKTRLSGYNPGTICAACERVLFDRQHLADPAARDDLATWVWDTGPMRDALARLDFQAVLVVYRSAAGINRRELGERAGLSESVIWYWEAGRRQGIFDIRQLLQLTDALQAPRLALLPVILGQPCALSDLMPGPAAVPAGEADHG